MNNLETIYNEALEMLKKGHSKQEVLLKYSEFSQELSPLLDASSLLLLMPKNQAPKPAMQRKYVFASSKRLWLAWLHVSKFVGVSASVALLISAVGVTAYVGLHSAPGQTLFAVKKSAEQARLLLAYDQADKANLQVSIAQQRLSAAQQIFNDPNSNVEQKKAALTELTQQTSTAVAEVDNVTQKDPTSEQTHPLVQSLESINKQQKTLLAQIQPDTQIKDDASVALKTADANTAKISAIKESIAIANNDQSLAQLAANPDSVAILGSVSQISSTGITVEKTKFTVTASTTIKDTQGNTVSLNDLAPKFKVNIVGLQDHNNLIAQQILVTSTTTADTASSTTQGEVKGDSTTTATSILNNIKKLELPKDDATTSSSTSNTAIGSFILEDPAPQFVGN